MCAKTILRRGTMTKECEKSLAGVFNPFLESARLYKQAVQTNNHVAEHRADFEKVKAALHAFLDAQHGESLEYGQIGPMPEWVGPIRGHIVQIDAELSKLGNNGQLAHNSAGLRLIPTFG